jgi:hypothetical protein
MKKICILLSILLFSFSGFASEESVELKKEVTGVNKEIYEEDSEVNSGGAELGDTKLEDLDVTGTTSEKDKLKELKLNSGELEGIDINVEDNLEQEMLTDLNEPKARSLWKYVLIGILVIAGASAF